MRSVKHATLNEKRACKILLNAVAVIQQNTKKFSITGVNHVALMAIHMVSAVKANSCHSTETENDVSFIIFSKNQRYERNLQYW